MAWTPKYNTKLQQPIIDNALRVIKRDEAEALSWAHGGEGLDPFKVHETARRVFKDFPALVLMTVEADPEENDDEGLLQVTHEVLVEIALTGEDPTSLEQKVREYAAAVAMILITADSQEFSVGTASEGMSTYVQVRNIRTGETLVHKTNAGLYYQNVTMRLLVRTLEA